MTLKCKCGGPLRTTYCTDPDLDVSHWTEEYECGVCGRTGGGRFPTDPNLRPDYWGCVDA